MDKFWYYFYSVARKLGLWKVYCRKENNMLIFEPKWFFQSKTGLVEW